MRKVLLIVALVAVSLLAGASSASAQCYGYYGWYGPSAYYAYWPSYYGAGYAYSYPTYYAPASYAYTYAAPTYSSAYYYAVPTYSSAYYVAPSYYYAAPATASYVTPAPVTTARQSFYPSTDYASMNVRLPDADAQVWFDGALMTQRGLERSFYTPALLLGTKYTYTIRARWTENGRTMDQQRLVEVEPGRTTTVDFRSPP